ncbi:hypothetical protein RRF57_010417 [Xylaria bambusicola]|uniref:Uncharacterized protein n=1 Tax=Xylaria bambusicola TaxID=326684 RepID=A0AAN7UUZ0_9PEZI
MSPLTIQAARLASRQALRASPVWQQAFRSPMSAQVARQYSTAGHAPADWGRIMRTRATTMLVYVDIVP